LGAGYTIANDENVCIGVDNFQGDRVFILMVSATAIACSSKIGIGLKFDSIVRDCCFAKTTLNTVAISIDSIGWRATFLTTTATPIRLDSGLADKICPTLFTKAIVDRDAPATLITIHRCSPVIFTTIFSIELFTFTCFFSSPRLQPDRYGNPSDS
jgi:hypothetical protein